MAPMGILQETEGSITNGNIWLMVSITATVQSIIIEVYALCMCVYVSLTYTLLIIVQKCRYSVNIESNGTKTTATRGGYSMEKE